MECAVSCSIQRFVGRHVRWCIDWVSGRRVGVVVSLRRLRHDFCFPAPSLFCRLMSVAQFPREVQNRGFLLLSSNAGFSLVPSRGKANCWFTSSFLFVCNFLEQLFCGTLEKGGDVSPAEMLRGRSERPIFWILIDFALEVTDVSEFPADGGVNWITLLEVRGRSSRRYLGNGARTEGGGRSHSLVGKSTSEI